MTEPRECCREAAKEIAANIRQLCMYAKTPEAIQQIIAKHCHAEAAKGRQSNLGAPGAHAEPWTIEVGPVPNRGQNETPYEDVSYSVRYPSGSFEVRQRVPNTAEGYAKAYARVARIVAGAPGAGQAGSVVEPAPPAHVAECVRCHKAIPVPAKFPSAMCVCVPCLEEIPPDAR